MQGLIQDRRPRRERMKNVGKNIRQDAHPGRASLHLRERGPDHSESLEKYSWCLGRVLRGPTPARGAFGPLRQTALTFCKGWQCARCCLHMNSISPCLQSPSLSSTSENATGSTFHAQVTLPGRPAASHEMRTRCWAWRPRAACTTSKGPSSARPSASTQT